jgi:hypothetical protein
MIADFAGMLPIRDPILLPDSNAQFAENTWLYQGKVRGFRHANSVYGIKYADTKQVYRIPNSPVNPPDFVNSTWLEFPDPYMAVVRNPTVGDQYSRYYFFPSDQYASTGVNPNWPATSPGPMFNTLARIQAGQPNYILGIPRPAIFPGVTPPNNEVLANVTAATAAGSTTLTFAAGAAANVLVGMTATDATDTFFTDHTNAASPAGSTVLYFGSTTGIQVGMLVSNLTNPASLFSGCTVAVVSPTTVTLISNLVDAVANGDLIKFDGGEPISAGTTVKSVSTSSTSSDTVEMTLPAMFAGVFVGDEIQFDVSIRETRAYVYTYVSGFGEEGQPSPATVVDGSTVGPWIITMTCPTTAQMANTNLTKLRLYRTVTDSTGATSYFQVINAVTGDGFPITTAGAVITYTDANKDSDITGNQQLSTVDFTPPPAGLQGVVMMANGIAVGWANNRDIWFSSPYQLWAWPGVFALSVDYPVVGLTPNGSSLNIITEGTPFVATGVTPDTMTMGKITANEPCIGRGSIIASGEGAYYASPNGYQLLNSSGTVNVTEGLMEKEFWTALQPNNFASGVFGQTLVCFIKGTGDGDENGVVIDYTAGSSDVKNVPFVYINTAFPLVNCYNDELSGQIFYLTDNQVLQWNPPSGGNLWSYVWKSKKFRFTSPQQFKAFLVLFDIPPEVTITPGTRNNDQAQTFDQTAQLLIVRVYADGNQLVVREVQTSGEVILIPGGSKWTLLEFQFEGQIDLRFFKVASSVKELKAV